MPLNLRGVMNPDARFRCETLSGPLGECRLSYRVCAMRQVVSELQTTQERERGQAPDYPSCVTSRCAQGRRIRELVDPDHILADSIRRAGPGGRWLSKRSDLRQQRAAQVRKSALGLLEEGPTLDNPPPPVPLGEHE